jgi:hypothetical protein
VQILPETPSARSQMTPLRSCSDQEIAVYAELGARYGMQNNMC